MAFAGQDGTPCACLPARHPDSRARHYFAFATTRQPGALPLSPRATASRLSGTVSSSVLAVLRLMTNSNFVGCIMLRPHPFGVLGLQRVVDVFNAGSKNALADHNI